MKTPVVLATVAALITGGLLPSKFQAQSGSAGADPRTPIDVVHTPGDADSLFRITEPGSYYLPCSLRGKVGKRGIEIASGGVTVDLMGFSLTGVPGSLEGIAAVGPNPFRSVRIENGHVTKWGQDGLDLVQAEMVHLSHVSAYANAGHGVELGSMATVVECFAQANGLAGMHANELVRYADCVATGNVEEGLAADNAASVDGCVVSGNESGLIAGAGSTAHGTIAYQNTLTGILSDVVRGCSSSENLAGIIASGVVSQSVARSNSDDGVKASGVIESVASILNGDEGIESRNWGALVRGNWAYGNAESGFLVDYGSVAEHNVARSNEFGLRANGRCVVRDNFANNNANQNYWWFAGWTLRGTEQDFDSGPLLDWHPGVNVYD